MILSWTQSWRVPRKKIYVGNGKVIDSVNSTYSTQQWQELDFYDSMQIVLSEIFWSNDKCRKKTTAVKIDTPTTVKELQAATPRQGLGNFLFL